jgi:hypothetical protein
VFAACLAAVAAGPARADVIYSNLGPDESYLRSSWSEDRYIRQAFAFTAGGTNATFDGARLALGLNVGPNEIDLRLYADAGGQPGAVLETMHASGQMPRIAMYTSGHLVTFTSAAHPLLQAGGTYWLLPFEPADSTTNAGWAITSSLVRSRLALSFLETEPMTWTVYDQQPEGAFEVNGTPSPVPEPGGLVLAGVGVLACLAARSSATKGQSGPRIKLTPTPAGAPRQGKAARGVPVPFG